MTALKLEFLNQKFTTQCKRR